MSKGRPRKIEPFLRGKTYFAGFYVDNKRKVKSLKTRDKTEALLLCKELDILSLNPHAEVSVNAQAVFFDKKKFEFTKAPKDVFQELAKAQNEIKQLKAQIEILRPFQQKYEALIQEREYRQLEAFKDLPLYIEVVEEYKEQVKHLAKNGTDHKSIVHDLGAHQNLWSLKISQINTHHIYRFLDFYSNNLKKYGPENKLYYEEAKHPQERWNRARIKLHRFFKWLSVVHNIDNIISRVEVKRQDIKPSIQWHSIEEVQEEISKQNAYWSAIIGIMAYAGLSSHEVRGLRVEDVTESYISINPNIERTTKSRNRIRQVEIHEKYLRPLINNYLSEVNKSLYFFPSCVAGSPSWLGSTFSKNFRNILHNKNINALSLRRTFGSLLLRSGKTSAEVAAAMGNTEEMVRKHYARLLGCEVNIDF